MRLSAAAAVLRRTCPPTGSPRRVHLETTSQTQTRTRTQTQTAGPPKYKTKEDLPGPSSAVTAYWLFVKGYADRSHAMQIEHKRLYGPIWRSQFGPYDIVNVASPELIAQVIKQEGRYPVRVLLPHWRDYRHLRGTSYGLHVNTGEEWYRIRQVLNPLLLKAGGSAAYVSVVHQVVGDLIGRVELLRQRSRDGDGTVSNLQDELYKFGFEAISSILFETRLGCLSEEVPPETLRFISAVNTMLTLSEVVIFLPHWTRHLLPFWGRFVQAWDDISDVANSLIDRKLRDLEAQAAAGGGKEVAGGGGYLTHLLASDTLPLGEIYTSVTELLLGGVDTTSNTLCWALYHLSRDGRVQDTLYREVTSVCPGRREPTVDDLTRMPYLKAVVKETLRMYPVVPGNGRLAVDNDVFVENYWFPKGTQFHLCHYETSHDKAEFEEADRLVPERWLRGQAAEGRGPGRLTHHPYSSIPFGVGVRACVGKRVAELEMYLTLSRLMQHYEVLPQDPDEVVEAKTRTLMIPAKPINLRFLSRA